MFKDWKSQVYFIVITVRQTIPNLDLEDTGNAEYDRKTSNNSDSNGKKQFGMCISAHATTVRKMPYMLYVNCREWL